MPSDFNLVSIDAQRALEEFSDDFALALAQGSVESWAKEYGRYKASRALKTTFYVPVSAAGYVELKGDIKYRELFQKSFSLVPKTWQDGWDGLASVIEAPDFIGWDSEAEQFAAAASSLLNELIATELVTNPVGWDLKAYFADDHPFNIFDAGVGSFDNDITGAGTSPSIANLKTAKANFRKIKGANGKPLGLRMTHVLIPSAQEETWKDLLEQDMLIQTVGSSFGAVGNRHKGTVKPIVSDELASDAKWYPLALNKVGMYPWVCQDEGAPEEILSDKSSDKYKRTLKVGVAYVLRANAALAMPHCAQRWEGLA